MFRITPIYDRDGATLRLEGRLGDQGAVELDRVCAPLLALRLGLRLDLEGLTFVDGAGLARLCRLLAQGARTVGGSPFVTQLLKECTQ